MKHVTSPPTARTLALDVLLECQRKEAFVQEILDRQLSRCGLSGPDRRLVTQLVYGILRRRDTLDFLLRPVVSRPLAEIQPWLVEILRLGAFQLALLDHIPAHAALFETVELANHAGDPRAKGFINAVLRRLLPILTSDRSEVPGPNALPFAAGTYRTLSYAALPSPATDPVEYLAAGFALPAWLVQRWLARHGWEECLRLGFWFAGPAPLWLRSNPLKISRDALVQTLRDAGMAAAPGVHPQSIRLNDSATIRDLPGFAEGQFVVQDESAMSVASALEPQPGSDVLDLCAAPGGKTTHLAELMNNQGRIVACDIDGKRLAQLVQSRRRLGLDIITTQVLDKNVQPPAGPFAAILVDVPCSNTGVLGRRPEVRWRLYPNELRRLVPQQLTLLRTAITRLKPGGVVVYSTCSIEPEENQQVVATVLKESPQLVLEADSEQRPGEPADGGYWARLRYNVKL